MEVYDTKSRILDIKRTGDEDTVLLTVTLDNGHIDHISFDTNYNFNVKRK